MLDFDRVGLRLEDECLGWTMNATVTSTPRRAGRDARGVGLARSSYSSCTHDSFDDVAHDAFDDVPNDVINMGGNLMQFIDQVHRPGAFDAHEKQVKMR